MVRGPAPFKENLRLLINEVLQSRCKLGPELLDSKVVLIHKKGDQESLRNYRPIALLTSTYQLINIILADRLQALAEKHRLLESSQFGFRWLTGVSNSVQKQNWHGDEVTKAACQECETAVLRYRGD